MLPEKDIPDVSRAPPKVWPSQPSPELVNQPAPIHSQVYWEAALPPDPLENPKPWPALSVLGHWCG